ncbi:MAG TPA: hypothetical protein VHJ82_10755 [Actinomycetota bacterium]|nr:hypothetical protein [Actinomycetota bacterium]
MGSLDLESVRAQIRVEGPLTFPGAIGASWTLFQLHALRLLKVFAPILLSLYVVAWGLFELAPIPEPASSQRADDAPAALFVGAFLNIIIGTCLSSVLVGIGAARIAAAGRQDLERTLPPMRDLVAAGLVVAMVPVALVLSGPLIVALPLLLRVLLGPPVVAHQIVFERQTLGEAFRSARSLLAGNWGRVFLWLLVVALVLNLASTASFSAANRLLSELLQSSALARFLLGLVAGAVEAILLVWLTAVSLVVYVDLRTRAGVAAE